MPYSLCDMDCDQETNKSDLVEHCSDCLCVGGPAGLDQQDVPATRAWRHTSVVEERDQPKTLSQIHFVSGFVFTCIVFMFLFCILLQFLSFSQT